MAVNRLIVRTESLFAGQLRFRPPVPPTPWKNPIDATARRAVCPQSGWFGIDGAEDCLHLDVYLPANVSSGTKLPIMVWIYGGGFNMGDKYFDGLYDARNFVRARQHIHVAMNYRLASLGFLALQELMHESGTTGNYGFVLYLFGYLNVLKYFSRRFLDQRAALQWVNDNADALGGDKTRITIFGESAGALSICWHLVSPMSKGLFTSVIMESGNCATNDLFQPLANNVAFSNVYINSLGCSNAPNLLDCLRNLPFDKVL